MIKKIINWPLFFASFVSSLMIVLLIKAVFYILKFVFRFKKVRQFFDFVEKSILRLATWTNNQKQATTKLNIIDLAIQNLLQRRWRTLLSGAGISLAVGLMVFCLSLGYGFEKMVVSQLTSRPDFNHVFITAGPSLGNLDKITFSVAQKLVPLPHKLFAVKSNPGSMVTKLGQIEMVVYGVDSNYMKKSGLKLIDGELLADESQSGIDFFQLPKIVINQSMYSVTNLKFDHLSPPMIDIIISGQEQPRKFLLVGIIEDGQPSPSAYVSQIELESIKEFDHFLLVPAPVNGLTQIRRRFEAVGFSTESMTDVLPKINQIFYKTRVVLFLMGVVGLLVAMVGMINTLISSFSERQREVGLMRVLGMKPEEVERLFITESLLLCLSGSLVGISAAWAAGKGLSFLVSILAISNGFEAINLTHIPWFVWLIVIAGSLIFGFVSGWYPARQASKVSPLDSLKLEGFDR